MNPWDWFPNDNLHVNAIDPEGNYFLADKDLDAGPECRWCWDRYSPTGEYLEGGSGPKLPAYQDRLLP